MTKTQIWRTAGVIKETDNSVTVVFDTGGAPFIYEPGQFINLTANIGGRRVTRSYSLSSCPGEDEQPSITVKRVPGGVMSGFIIEQAAQVREWEIDGPHGAFTPSAATYGAGHVVLLAGGSGITPLLSIARALISRAPGRPLTLVYSSRSEEEIIFRDKIEMLRANGSVTIHHALSQPAEGSGGRLNKLVAKKLIKQAPLPPEDAHYFICGPAGLMKMHHEILSALQVPEGNIYTEWFNPEPAAPAVDLPQEVQEVLLHFYDQYNLLEVQPGQTILSAALADKIPLPFSCSAGTCGTCAARVIAGKVSMANNYALRQTDVEEGMVLLCQSYPLTPDVTVEIG